MKKIIALLAVVCLSILIFACEKEINIRYEHTKNYSENLQGVTTLNVAYSSGEVEILTHENADIEVVEKLSKEEDNYKHIMSQTDSVFGISEGDRPTMQRVYAHIIIKVPKELFANLKVTVSSGQVEITNLTVVGELDVSANSGRIEIKNITAKTINLGASSGKIDGKNIIADTINAKTNSGVVDLTDIKSSGKFSATSGAVDLEFSEINGDIEVEVNSGAVEVEIPQNYSFNVDISTNSGSITTDFTDLSSTNTSLKGTVGQDPQFNVKVKTTSGHIALEKR